MDLGAAVSGGAAGRTRRRSRAAVPAAPRLRSRGVIVGGEEGGERRGSARIPHAAGTLPPQRPARQVVQRPPCATAPAGWTPWRRDGGSGGRARRARRAAGTVSPVGACGELRALRHLSIGRSAADIAGDAGLRAPPRPRDGWPPPTHARPPRMRARARRRLIASHARKLQAACISKAPLPACATSGTSVKIPRNPRRAAQGLPPGHAALQPPLRIWRRRHSAARSARRAEIYGGGGTTTPSGSLGSESRVQSTSHRIPG